MGRTSFYAHFNIAVDHLTFVLEFYCQSFQIYVISKMWRLFKSYQLQSTVAINVWRISPLSYKRSTEVDQSF